MINLVEYKYLSPDTNQSHLVLMGPVRKSLESLQAGATLLDLGCGNGAFIAALAKPDWKVDGVDSSLSGIDQARRHYPRFKFALGDVTGDLTEVYAAESFDAILCAEVIEHVYDPRSLVRNCQRLLKPGGFVVITTPYNGYLKYLALSIAGKMDHHWDPLWDGGHIKFWSCKTLTKLLEEFGFKVARFDGAGRCMYLWKSMVVTAVKPR